MLFFSSRLLVSNDDDTSLVKVKLNLITSLIITQQRGYLGPEQQTQHLPVEVHRILELAKRLASQERFNGHHTRLKQLLTAICKRIITIISNELNSTSSSTFLRVSFSSTLAIKSSFKTSRTSSLSSTCSRASPLSVSSTASLFASIPLSVSSPTSSSPAPICDLRRSAPCPSRYGMPRNRFPMSRPICNRFSSYSISYLLSGNKVEIGF